SLALGTDKLHQAPFLKNKERITICQPTGALAIADVPDPEAIKSAIAFQPEEVDQLKMMSLHKGHHVTKERLPDIPFEKGDLDFRGNHTIPKAGPRPLEDLQLASL